jgi:hypothetical protein
MVSSTMNRKPSGPEKSSTFACMSLPLRFEVLTPAGVPGRGLEPLRISPPDPKSGASAKFRHPGYLIINDLHM